MNGSLVVNGSFNCSASSSVIYTTPWNNDAGQIYLNGASGNYVGNQTGIATPTSNTRRVGLTCYYILKLALALLV